MPFLESARILETLKLIFLIWKNEKAEIKPRQEHKAFLFSVKIPWHFYSVRKGSRDVTPWLQDGHAAPCPLLGDFSMPISPW